MLISRNWLNEFVFLNKNISSDEIARKLTLSTVEVEGFEDKAALLDKVFVGVVEKCSKHPDADKLKVCEVNVGPEGKHKIVCGGINVKKGIKVAVALPGAKVRWHGEGDLIEIKPTKLRGVESNGMICASEEIGLGEMYPSKEKEIMNLNFVEAKEGTLLAEALNLNEAIFDIDNKSLSNRPDLWGHYGMAREVAALFNLNLSGYKPKEISKAKSKISLSVKNESTDLCSRYMVVAISGVSTKESPEWLKQKLLAVGANPKNILVDVVNYVMYEIGQPMHAFDAEKIKNKEGKIEITVRRAKNGEKFKSLNNDEIETEENQLVIANKKEILAIAGVIGGDSTAVNSKTKTIVLEAATFDAVSVRETSTKLGIRTESSTRFEKALDPNFAELGLKKVVEILLNEFKDAEVVSGVIDEYSKKIEEKIIKLEKEFIPNFAGIEIKNKEIKDILERLGFSVSEKGSSFIVKVPSWRSTKDVSIKEDLAEEVLRIFGFDKVKGSLPSFPALPPETNKLREIENNFKDILTLKFGMKESYNYSFVSSALLKKLGLNLEDHIELDNPLAKDRPFLRRVLAPGLLEVVEKNSHNSKKVSVYEFGKTFLAEEAGVRTMPNSSELLPKQDLILSFCIADKNNNVPFYKVSYVLEKCLNSVNIKFNLNRKLPENWKFLHPGRSASVEVNGKSVGVIGEVHPSFQEKLGIPFRTAICELNINEILEFASGDSKYKEASSFPSVERDLAFVVDKSVSYKELLKVIKNSDNLIENVELFDVFEGEKIGKTKKSMAFHIVYSSHSKTLKKEEVDEVHKKLIQKLKKEFAVEIR